MIQEIELNKLKIHPRNLRKKYNDIEELADSIKAKGILQNLTVIEDKEEPGTYFVVIGNRRLTAALKAGIETAPCFITELDEKEQASMMLLENMQRDDLTIYEQAQGFQMVLDLGETEEGLSEKTGFSKSTIRRRLNIAKLDQGVLEEKEQDASFQMSLKDLYELEKIKDIKKRNKILKDASSSRDLTCKVQSEVSEAKRNDACKKIISMLKKNGIEPAPEGADREMYTNKWETIKSFSLYGDVPEKIKEKAEGKEKLYYLKYFRELKVIRRTKKVKKERTPAEIEKDERDSRKKKIKAIAKNMAASRREFILNLISGKIESIKDTSEIEAELWKVMRAGVAYVSNDSMESFLLGKMSYEATDEEKESVAESVEKLSVLEQTMIAAYNATKESEFTDYNGKFREEVGKMMKLFYGVLGKYGFSYGSDEEQKIVEGTHELYTKKETSEE